MSIIEETPDGGRKKHYAIQRGENVVLRNGKIGVVTNIGIGKFYYEVTLADNSIVWVKNDQLEPVRLK